MRILVVGTGGREHALLWKLGYDAPGAELFCTAGNAGMEAAAEPVALKATDVVGLLKFARDRAMDLTVVGPEAALEAGIVDAFADAGLAIFGPRRSPAEIETSKSFAKAFMARHSIPTAAYRVFTDLAAAEAWLRAGEGPIVVKASGLSAGKGAVVCEDRGEAGRAAADMLRDGRFGDAGREIVIEEWLEGREISVIALTDGEHVRPLLPVRDHKRALDGDRGPNTGGMGAIAPVPDVSQALLDEVSETVLRPAVRGLAREGRSFRGALYAGMLLTAEGPRVIEFNARFGDPETQALLPLLRSSLLELLLSCAEPGRPCDRRPSLRDLEVRWKLAASCCVVAASGGYPGSFESGVPIDLDEEPPRQPEAPTGAPWSEAFLGPQPAEASTGTRESIVFHGGTVRRGGGLVTAGGRVLAVTGLAADPVTARSAAYERLLRIRFEGMHFRRDIGLAESGVAERR